MACAIVAVRVLRVARAIVAVRVPPGFLGCPVPVGCGETFLPERPALWWLLLLLLVLLLLLLSLLLLLLLLLLLRGPIPDRPAPEWLSGS